MEAYSPRPPPQFVVRTTQNYHFFAPPLRSKQSFMRNLINILDLYIACLIDNLKVFYILMKSMRKICFEITYVLCISCAYIYLFYIPLVSPIERIKENIPPKIKGIIKQFDVKLFFPHLSPLLPLH